MQVCTVGFELDYEDAVNIMNHDEHYDICYVIGIQDIEMVRNITNITLGMETEKGNLLWSCNMHRMPAKYAGCGAPHPARIV